MELKKERDPEKEVITKRRHFAFRLNIFFFCVFFLFSILIVRLAILQFVEGEELKALKYSNSIAPYDIPPIRGNIYDSQGSPIAVSTSTQSLYYQYDSSQSADDIIALAYRLEKVFAEFGERDTPMTAEKIVLAMNAGVDIHKNKVPITDYYSSLRRIITDLSDQEVAYIMEHRDEMKNVDIVEESVRIYDEQKISVQLVGYLRQYSTAIDRINYYKTSTENYLTTENVGFDGIELMYEKELRGKNGSKTYPVNALGQIIGDPIVKPPTIGNSLYLTINKDIQLETVKKIEEHLDYLRTDPTSRKINAEGIEAHSAFAVAMEVDTGKVVAMVNYPDYDPNIWRGGRISPENWNEYQYLFPNGTITGTMANFTDSADRAKHPGSLVPLGSTIKPLTILIGLKEGFYTTTGKYSTPHTFFYGRDNSKVSNSSGVPSGTMSVQRALAVSSNTFMAGMIGDPLYRKYATRENPAKGVEVWDEYMAQFGLGVTTGSGLPGEHPGVKEYNSMVKNASAQAALVFSSFGQGGKYTVLQLAQYASTLATRGKRMMPQFVDKIVSYDGQIVQGYEPKVLSEAEFEESHWNLVQAAMEEVKMQGFEGFPHRVASKTGTSEQQVSGKTVENAVFIAYAPADKPKLAVAVVVPEGGYGSWGAAPIARAMFDAYDKSVGLKATAETE